MFNLLFQETAETLVAFLEQLLPQLSDNWWKTHVINILTFQQKRFIEENKIKRLSEFDLSALLRILDQNWHEIAYKASLPKEARHWVKELQTIRNRWAHLSSDKLSQEDLYRDIDTLQRFLEAINGKEALINKVRDQKKACISTKSELPNDFKQSTNKLPILNTEYNLGEIVSLRSNPSIRGAITKIIPGETENRYEVFIDGTPQPYYASQLIKKDEKLFEKELVSLDLFYAYLTSLQLRNPSISNLYSLHAGRINFVPYQFKPVLKLIRSDRPRLLIADEVGVGKTIEAGLILREIQARRDIESILIICPKPLVIERKWQTELKRFDEHFEHIDGKALRYCIEQTDLDGFWPEKYSKCIMPFSLFSEEMLFGRNKRASRRRLKGLIELDPLPHFDLVIVDEAHHVRNTETLVHQGVRYFCDNAEAVVFLSATPVQLGSNDLFVLLNILRSDLILDRATFEHMAEPNPYLNKAVGLARGGSENWQINAKKKLTEASETNWGKTILQDNPVFQKLYDMLSEKELDNHDRITFIKDTEELHTFSSIINRTRRRDIGNFTTRKPDTVMVDFTPQQRQLHDKVLLIQTKILKRLHNDKNVKFMMSTIRRQAASCLFGLAPLLKDILTRRINELQFDEIEPLESPFSYETFATIEEEIKSILTLAENIDRKDIKLEKLLKVIREKQERANNKILLFSSFRHTLKYIFEHLRNNQYRVGLIHGDTPDEERLELRSRFSYAKENPYCIDILLSSEVGCEGLDYEFCDCIVNYDLPWNPMRIEQRIGRIDRYGQRSETVAIYNLITEGTVDADIYERCLWRIGVFHNALGGSEEILGKITSEIHEVAENLTLTIEERRLRLQQLADNEIRQLKEQTELEEKQFELFGLKLPLEQTNREIQQASSCWLTPASLFNLMRQYLDMRCGREQEYILGEKEPKTLRLNQEARNKLLEDLKKLNRKPSQIYREWEKWLKGSNPHLQITFNDKYAAENRDIIFITPVHPLSLQAAQAFDAQTTIYTAFKTTANKEIDPGNYPFAIYKWQKTGIRDDITFQPICSVQYLTDNFFELLEHAIEIDISTIAFPDQHNFDELDKYHHQIWSASRAQHQADNMQLVLYKKESLKTSHKARVSILHEQLNKATDERIIRMRQSELQRAEADFQRRLEELGKSEEKADISVKPIAFGVIILQG